MYDHSTGEVFIKLKIYWSDPARHSFEHSMQHLWFITSTASVQTSENRDGSHWFLQAMLV